MTKSNTSATDINVGSTCNNCIYCVKDEGKPYYCAIQDLFTWVNPTDKACEDFLRDGSNG